MSDTMVERVAMALHQSKGRNYYARARAAITAMKEPTEKMCQEGGAEIWDYEPGFTPSVRVARDTWIAMIDTALDDAP